MSDNRTASLNAGSGEDLVAVILPPNWWPITLGNPQTVKQRIRDITIQRIGKEDKYAKIRAEIRQNLEQGCTTATDSGYSQVAVFAMDMADMSITGSMVTRMNPSLIGSTVDDVRDTIAKGEPLASVTADTFEDGWIVRSITQTAIDRKDARGNPLLPDLRVEYRVFKDNLPAVAEFVFSTPFIPLREALVELFDSIALSVHRAIKG